MILSEEVLARMDKYPKAKYELIINQQLYYSFVTTGKSEEQCIEILKEKSKNFAARQRRKYKIIKKQEDKKEIIYAGSIMPV